MDCTFCDIAENRAEASRIAESDCSVAFLDQRQAVPGHVLVAPRRHVGTIYQLDQETAADVMRLAVHVANALRVTYDPPGLSLWQSNGEAGGQEVDHFHLHLQPRHHGDGLLRVYPGSSPAPMERLHLEILARDIRSRLA